LLADRALAVEAGLAELVGFGRVPEVISGAEALVDGEREDLLEEGGRKGDQPVLAPLALDDAEPALLDV
jgi:hypothetical protein